MRPTAGSEMLAERSRKSSFGDNPTSTPTPGPNTQTTYFLAREEDMERSQSSITSTSERSSGVFGVQSLEETIASTKDTDSGEEEDNEADDGTEYSSRRLSRMKSSWLGRPASSLSKRPGSAVTNVDIPSALHTHVRRLSQATISQPITPLSLQSPPPGSPTPSTPRSLSTKSFRASDAEESGADDSISQAVISSGEEETELPSEIQDSAPQLIMPSIKMPSRRPFTDKGKDLGRLKILIAGENGVGKTLLIKSIVQTCEDIVHVDPLSSTVPSIQPSSKRHRSGSRDQDNNSTKQITEVYASTKPYPIWWQDNEESRVLRRRKSMGDTVLERNLCFVDTPGYGKGMSLLEHVEPVVKYVESQMERVASMANMTDGDILSLMSGNGAQLVDVVFYVVSQKLKPVDLEFLRRLSALSNIVPVIAKADTMSSEHISRLKSSIMSDLYASNIRTFFTTTIPFEGNGDLGAGPPYAISSAPSSDADTMDASLLMSPDYVQPLIPSDLGKLVDRVFEKDTISWLRHSSAKKFIHWRNGTSSVASSLSSQQLPHTALPAFPISSPLSSSISSSTGAHTYTLARITDHTQREERLAQVRLAKWATNLQRSLQNERERYERLARAERAVWLTERLGECVIDGEIVPVSGRSITDANFEPDMALTKRGRVSRKMSPGGRAVVFDARDPLGLLGLGDDLRRRGWVVLQVLGSLGVIGGVAVWCAKRWGVGLGISGPIEGDWSSTWGIWGGAE